jgi:hypothetical protein
MKSAETNKICGIALALVCGLATPLKAQVIYVVNNASGTIGEYGLDGSTINASLITNLNSPFGIAISGNDVFVANNGADTVGEYTTSGATVNASLISGLPQPNGLAISGNDLFVGCDNNSYSGNANGFVGEYTTSGARVNASVITSLFNPYGIAISGNDIFVANYYYNWIGEYTTGGPVNSDIINCQYEPWGIAISGTNVFITQWYESDIGEYSTSGATVNASLIGQLDGPSGIAILGTNIFVVNYFGGTVGEYTLSGATINTSLITGLNHPFGIAIGPPSPPDLTSISVNGSTLKITAINGQPGGTFTLLESTSPLLPLAQWAPALTNTFGSTGSLNLSTNIVNPSNPCEYYILEVPLMRRSPEPSSVGEDNMKNKIIIPIQRIGRQ